MDPQGDYEDWVELYNNTDKDISLKGYTLSDDNSDLQQWTFPDTFIAANGYLLIWADKDDGNAGLHASFKLSASGEAVFLSNHSNEIIDEVTFGAIPTDTTYIMSPTPGAENENVVVSIKENVLSDKNVRIFPNPVKDFLTIQLLKESSFSIRMTNINGSIVYQEMVPNSEIQVDLSNYTPGLYFLHLSGATSNFAAKIIIK